MPRRLAVETLHFRPNTGQNAGLLTPAPRVKIGVTAPHARDRRPPVDARRFVEAYGGDAKLSEWGEALHELFNELEKDKMLAEIVAFLDSQG